MPPETELPAEIVDLIIAELVDHAGPSASTPDLRSCALVSRMFCMRAHRHLFSEFKVSIFFPSNSAFKSESFLDLLNSSLNFPTMGMIYHLRSFHLVLEFEDLQLSKKRNLFDQVFPNILATLHGPHHGISGFSLDLQAKDHNGPRSVDWSLISPNFHSAFHALCCSPDLTTLRLKHLLNMPRTILRGLRIRHLELQVVHFADSDPQIDDDPTRRHDVTQPESLVIPTYWLLPTVVVALGGNVKPLLEFNDRFQLAFAYLTDLTITVVNHNRAAYLYLMPQLRSLRLLHLFIYPTYPKQLVHPTVDFFSYPENNIPSSLQHLTIEAKADSNAFSSEEVVREMKRDSKGWPAFDSLLSGSEFRKVQDIHFWIRFQPPKGGEATPMARCREIILKHLPRLTDTRPTTFLLDITIDQ